MTAPIRVLVVDDSLLVRKVLSDILGSNPATEVAGTAASGEMALVKIPQLKPDVVTLDIEMPGMNGLQTLAQIRKLYPKLPVIMFSTLTEHGAAETLEALALGATDYAAKPSSSEGLASAKQQVASELIPKITGLRAPVTPLPQPSQIPSTRAPIRRRIDIVAIGTSTGGPNALAEVIPALPSNFPVPVVVVQHMPAMFTRLLAKHLGGRAQLDVQEGNAAVTLQPGHIWIAPGDYHMMVARDGNAVRIRLNQDAPEHSCRPAVDVLFRSVAKTFGPHALAVVMTGMGSDGTLGAKAIRQAGGEVLIQDAATSVVWGMPGAVASAGLADQVCALGNIAPEIVRRVEAQRPATARRSAPPSSTEAEKLANTPVPGQSPTG
jgi:two-component system, chemotaxis family, protein-glutamate methylesterase/glutaminase